MSDADGPKAKKPGETFAGKFAAGVCLFLAFKAYQEMTAPTPAPPADDAPAASAVAADRPPEATPRAVPPPPEVTLEIVPAAGVDERLFLMRALESLYECWPVGVEDPDRLRDALDALRHEAARHERYIRERGLDDRVAGLYGDLAGLVDAYSEGLAAAGRIEREGGARADKERAEGLTRSGLSGGVLAGRALDAGASGREALATWAGVTLLGSLLDEFGKAPARDEAKRQALEANARAFEARYSAVVATAEAAADVLAGKYGWARGEAGFDAAPEQGARVVEAVARGDAAELLRYLEVARTRRPRDPFVRYAVAVQGAAVRGASPEVLSAGAEECLAAATLVPRDPFYDRYRADFLVFSGSLATEAASKELGGRGWGAAPAARGPRALSIWRAYLRFDPVDPTGEAREQLAWSLAVAGRPADAAEAASKVAGLRGNDAGFSYNYACVLSLAGDTPASLRWLEHAFRDCGLADIRHARSDPDLAAVRAREAGGFRELSEVKFAWSIDWGVLDHDDIILVNNSPFPLTGVRLDLTFGPTVRDSKGWKQSLTAERVEAGATHRWRAWVTARGQGASGVATLDCDQRR